MGEISQVGYLTRTVIHFGITLGAMQPFRVAHSRELGISDARLRSREFAAPFHGVRSSHGIERDVAALARAYAVKMRRDAGFSHVTAAQLLGAPLPVRFAASPVHVTVPSGTAPVRGRGVAGHHLTRRLDFAIVGGLRVLAPPEVWLTLAELLAVPDLVAVGDAFVGSPDRPAVCSLADLADVLAAHPRARGRAVLRAALPFIRIGAASRPESLLRVLLCCAGFPDPVLNHRIPGLPYLVDLAWPEFRFGMEYDGGHHRTAEQFASDVSRQEIIHDSEWLLMRVQKEDLFDDALGVVARARRRLAGRGLVVPARAVPPWAIPRR